MSKTILHLDDEAEIRELLAVFLRTKGYHVISVASAHEALAAARRETVNLVITDLQLDEEDGLDTIQQLKSIRPETPIMILTGVLMSPGVAQKTMGQQVASYLEKTTPLAHIHEEVHRLLGS